jgi:hypothetical protein
MQTSGKDSEKGAHLSEMLLSFARHQHVEPGRIARLIRESESFREICGDYEECCARLLSLKQNAVSAGVRVRDYEEMRDHLERDLLRYLESAGPLPKQHDQDKAQQDLRQTERAKS